MTIVIYEPVCCDQEHAQFNASLIETIANISREESIFFLGEEKHVKQVKVLLPESMAELFHYEILTIPPRLYKPRKRIVQDFRNARHVVKLCNKLNSEKLILSSVRESVLFAIVLAHSLTKSANHRINIIIHMEMRKVVLRARNPFTRFFDFTSALKLACSKGINFLVLEKCIKLEAQKYIPFIKNHLKVLLHPVVSRRLTTHQLCTEKVRVGFLGATTKRKGFDVFCKFARISKQIGGISCSVIGSSRSDAECSYIGLFDEGPFAERIPIERYNKLIEQLDYVCVFLDRERYRLSASGTLLDAFSFGKPIIATSLPVLADLEAEYGDIGFVCESEADFESVLIELKSEQAKSRYIYQQLSVKAISKDRSPQALANIFKHYF